MLLTPLTAPIAIILLLAGALRRTVATLVLGDLRSSHGTGGRSRQRGAVELTTVLLLAGGIAAATLLVVEILTGKVTDLASGIPTQ